MEAVIPTEIRVPTLQTEIPKKANTEVIVKDLEMADELREAAIVCMASYQQSNKLIKHPCKTACISSRRPSL